MADTAICQLSMPNQSGLYDQVIANHRGATAMLTLNARAGQTIVICGAGPSLRDAVLPDADEVWACNSALNFLMARGERVTHGVTIDQGRAMLDGWEWGRSYPVGYYLASSVHPDLVAKLRADGRALTFFHSFLGVPAPEDWAPREGFGGYEDWLYRKLYPASCCVGQGLNTVPRAVCLALALGAASIEVYGADCACAPDGEPVPCLPGEPGYAEWLDSLVMYADGRTPRWYGDETPMAEAELGGHRWHSRPDMVVSAMHMLELQRVYPGRITYHGDTMIEALRGVDPRRLPALDNGRVLNFAPPGALAGA